MSQLSARISHLARDGHADLHGRSGRQELGDPVDFTVHPVGAWADARRQGGASSRIYFYSSSLMSHNPDYVKQKAPCWRNVRIRQPGRLPRHRATEVDLWRRVWSRVKGRIQEGGRRTGL